ncbi:LuxR C-terminal-related transcriptional regulator [Streptomyces sp. NPDC006645]|uniref:LuxR C-terminal-related transcriptional regulator n=1 Tax=unclassified Streptomyces TaxID=2593676 RepID=UPI0033A170B7
MIAQHGDGGPPAGTAGAKFAGEISAVSGGNPLLLRALLAECAPPAGRAGEVRLEPGLRGPFARSVLTCLARGGAVTHDVAVAMAVLGERSGLDLLSALLDVTPASAHQGTQILNATGIADGYRFRHPIAEAAVLESLPAQRRAALHSRAAALLYARAADSTEIARHLTAAGRAEEPWGVAVLQDAATHVIAGDDAEEALRLLNLAEHACGDEKQRAVIRLSAAIITCRLNPSVGEQQLTDTVRAHRTELLTPMAGSLLSRMTLRSAGEEQPPPGPLPSTSAPPARQPASPPGPPGPPAPQAPSTTGRGKVQPYVRELWSTLLMVHQGGTPPAPAVPDTASAAPVPTPPRPRAGMLIPAQSAASSLWLAADADLEETAAAAAERSLHISPLVDSTLPALINHLKVLAFTGRSGSAEEFALRFDKEAGRRNAPGWQTLFASALAEIALLRGAFPEALAHALRATELVPLRSHSVFAVGVKVSRIVAHTAMGQYAAAGVLLEQAVPEQLFANADVFAYLRARGRYHLATDNAAAAMNDLGRIGELAGEWGMDRPALVPWRLDAAEARLALGETERAAELITGQLESYDTSTHRVRGMSLRLRAAVSPQSNRIRLLRQAVGELHWSRDGYELARALADLARAYEEAGDDVKGRMTKRRAWRLAKERSAEPLCAQILPGFELGSDELAAEEEATLERLSESERKVAILATRGYTNREIASRLYVTVSTVEQHLTRIYRKLEIAGRRELQRVTVDMDEAV